MGARLLKRMMLFWRLRSVCMYVDYVHMYVNPQMIRASACYGGVYKGIGCVCKLRNSGDVDEWQYVFLI